MKYSIIVLNIGLLVYFFGSIIKNYIDFVPVEGTLVSAEKSGNRIPYYSFNLKEFDCTFQNKGNSFLALLSNNKYVYEKIHTQGSSKGNTSYLFDDDQNSEAALATDKVTFYIHKSDQGRLTENQKVFYAGIRFANQPEKKYINMIDSYYYTLRNGRSVLYILLFFLLGAVLVFSGSNQWVQWVQSDGFSWGRLLLLTDFLMFFLLLIV